MPEETNKTPAVKPGDAVVLVGAGGKKHPAKVTAVRKGGGLIDVTLGHNGSEVAITSSPYDAAAKRTDSWHVPAEPAKKDEQPAKK